MKTRKPILLLILLEEARLFTWTLRDPEQQDLPIVPQLPPRIVA